MVYPPNLGHNPPPSAPYFPPQAIAAVAVITASRTFRNAARWSALGGVNATSASAKAFAASRSVAYRAIWL